MSREPLQHPVTLTAVTSTRLLLLQQSSFFYFPMLLKSTFFYFPMLPKSTFFYFLLLLKSSTLSSYSPFNVLLLFYFCNTIEIYCIPVVLGHFAFGIIDSLFCVSFWLKGYNALCVYPHCKVSIGQYTKMCTSPLIFFQLHYFRCQIFEENIWSLSLSLYIWPLESWTIIAIIRFNSILRTIWGRVEC